MDGGKQRNGNPGAVEARGEIGMLNPDDIAGDYWQMYQQSRSACSFKWDPRPFKATF